MSEPVRFADELPPLPTPEAWRTRVGPWGDHSTDYAYTVNQMREYAAVAVAERDAEIGRLRGENKALQDGIVRDLVDVGVKNAITELRAEVEALRAYALAAVALEREACADICDQHASVEGIAQRCAAAIRARGSE